MDGEIVIIEHIIKNFFKSIFDRDFILNSAYQINSIKTEWDQQTEGYKHEHKHLAYLIEVEPIVKSILELEKFYNQNINQTNKKLNLLSLEDDITIKVKSKLTPNTQENEETPEFTTDDPVQKELLIKQIEEERVLMSKKNLEMLIEAALNKYEEEDLIDFFEMINKNQELKDNIFKIKGDEFKKRVDLEQKILQDTLNTMHNNEGFIDVSTSTFKCSYKKDNDTSMTMKIESELNVPLIHFLSMVYELDMYEKWFPFMNSSKTLVQVGKAKKLCYMRIKLTLMPIQDRDFFTYAFGVNRLKRDGLIIVCCQSIDTIHEAFEENYIPPKKDCTRAAINYFGFEIKVVNNHKIKVKYVLNCDMKLPIPQFLIDFGNKQFPKLLFENMKKVTKNYEGSEYENKNPSEIDQKFYSFIKKEARKYLDSTKLKELNLKK